MEEKKPRISDTSKSSDFDGTQISKKSDVECLTNRIEKLKNHSGKNKADKSMQRCLMRKKAKLIKLVKYKAR